MNKALRCLAAWMFTLAAASSVVATEAEKYSLRYKFQPGETVRWEVERRTNTRTTVSRETKTIEMVSVSVKAWHVTEVNPDGTATFRHSVDWVDMRNNVTGRDEVHYDSRTDAKPPADFEEVAKTVGVPFLTVTMDATGKVLHRTDMKSHPDGAPKEADAQHEGWMTIPLPKEPVPVGYKWSLPLDMDIRLEGGAVKKIKAVQQFTLEEVKTGVATIRVSTDILTLITDPAVESQLVERDPSGRVRFDIDAGRVISQQMDSDKHVVGFRGGASSIHYVNRFSEQLLPEQVKTAENAGGEAVAK
jgi:hypothetical protein